MKRFSLKYLLPIILLFIVSISAAQPGFNPYASSYDPDVKRSPVRAVLNKFSVMFSFGYARTYYNIPIESGGIVENGSNPILINNVNSGAYTSYTGLSNWVNNPTIASDSVPSSAVTLYSADTSSIRYKGSGYSIPLNLSLHIDIDRFRIGGGISYDFHGFNALDPKGGPTLPYEPDFNMTRYRKIYVLLGGQVYYFRGWMYNAELHVGKVKYRKQYDTQNLQNGLYFNLGIPAEYEFSEYFYFYVRPYAEFKSYTLTFPEEFGGGDASSSMSFKQPTFGITIGFRYKFPEVRRCPVRSCRIQLKHVHSNKEYRGQPFYKEQNPKIGELNENPIHNYQNRKRKTH